MGIRHVLAVLVVAAGAFCSLHQTRPGWHWEKEPLPFSQPHAAVVEVDQLAPPSLGYFAWVSGGRLTFRFSQLGAGDLIKIKALAQGGRSSWDVLLDGEKLATLRFGVHFTEARLVLPRAGHVLQLQR